MKNSISKNIRLQKDIKRFLCILSILSFLSCAISIPEKKETKKVSKVTYRERGIASWYGKKFHGRLTASGEVYDMYGISAAHKTLPLGTVCKVTNLRNGRSIVLRINDRGPFVKGRIIDLSYGAAKKLGFAKEGLTEVLIEANVKKKRWIGDYSIQVGSFIYKKNAVRLKNKLAKKYGSAFIEKYNDGKNTYYRVKVGHFKTPNSANNVMKKLSKEGFDAFIVSNK
ncbi:MAG: septal ring lytic transglycosylase RlpA family protein [Candidatus Schekmanbacteria bacterium]|nr:MAG: septal ring lytic transglycosylase RlpA family protein [Candidatus Schekmanbacteria bacterium]